MPFVSAVASGAFDGPVASADIGAALLTAASTFALPGRDATTGRRSAWTGFGLNWTPPSDCTEIDCC